VCPGSVGGLPVGFVRGGLRVEIPPGCAVSRVSPVRGVRGVFRLGRRWGVGAFRVDGRPSRPIRVADLVRDLVVDALGDVDGAVGPRPVGVLPTHRELPLAHLAGAK